VGDGLCKFFEALDPHLYLKPHDHPDYKKYFKSNDKTGDNQNAPTANEHSVPVIPDSGSFRIAKTFGNLLFFGTASPSKESGEYEFNITYDDGDHENMTRVEAESCAQLCNTKKRDPRSQLGYDKREFELLPKKFKFKQIHDHKIIIDSSNCFVACVKVDYSIGEGVKAQTHSAWVQLGTLMSYSRNIESLWSALRNYIEKHYIRDEDKFRFHEHLFQFFAVSGGRRSSRYSNKNSNMNMISYNYDPSAEEVMCVSANQRLIKKGIDQVEPLMSRHTMLISKDTVVPTSYPEACSSRDTQWVDATTKCVEDMKLANIGKWVRLVDAPSSISSRFVYQAKARPENRIEAFCRWTPRGFEEIPNEHFDPDNIFSGTPQLWALRLILVKALTAKWPTFHIDFKRAFSQVPLKERVHVRMPKGYVVHDDEGYEMCLLLEKSSEGLKQSSANWSEFLDDFLLKDGFERCIKEPKLFKKKIEDGSWAYIEVYVDDIYGTCKTKSGSKHSSIA
jgi:hypothetical protein